MNLQRIIKSPPKADDDKLSGIDRLILKWSLKWSSSQSRAAIDICRLALSEAQPTRNSHRIDS